MDSLNQTNGINNLIKLVYQIDGKVENLEKGILDHREILDKYIKRHEEEHNHMYLRIAKNEEKIERNNTFRIQATVLFSVAYTLLAGILIPLSINYFSAFFK